MIHTDALLKIRGKSGTAPRRDSFCFQHRAHQHGYIPAGHHNLILRLSVTHKPPFIQPEQFRGNCRSRQKNIVLAPHPIPWIPFHIPVKKRGIRICIPLLQGYPMYHLTAYQPAEHGNFIRQGTKIIPIPPFISISPRLSIMRQNLFIHRHFLLPFFRRSFPPSHVWNLLSGTDYIISFPHAKHPTFYVIFCQRQRVKRPARLRTPCNIKMHPANASLPLYTKNSAKKRKDSHPNVIKLSRSPLPE